jgi:hypothetical protein
VLKSVSGLEANPKSKGQAMVLSECAVEAHLENDTDIAGAISELLEELEREKAATTGVRIETTMSGGMAGVLGAQNVVIHTMYVGTAKPEES